MDFSLASSWMFFGAVLCAAEMLWLPGVGMIVLGLGAIITGVLLQFGLIVTPMAQGISFFAVSAIWAVIIWKPLMKSHNSPDDGYHDMVGTIAVVGVKGLSRGKTGEVKWSGSVMNARIADECDVKKIESGSEVEIVKVLSGVLLVTKGE